MNHLQINYNYWKGIEEAAALEVKKRLEEEERMKAESANETET